MNGREERTQPRRLISCGGGSRKGVLTLGLTSSGHRTRFTWALMQSKMIVNVWGMLGTNSIKTTRWLGNTILHALLHSILHHSLSTIHHLTSLTAQLPPYLFTDIELLDFSSPNALPHCGASGLSLCMAFDCQEVCTGKFRHMGWGGGGGLGCLIQITKNIVTFTSHGPYILHDRKIDFWACKELIQNVSQLQVCQRQSLATLVSATMVPWPLAQWAPVVLIFL